MEFDYWKRKMLQKLGQEIFECVNTWWPRKNYSHQTFTCVQSSVNWGDLFLFRSQSIVWCVAICKRAVFELWVRAGIKHPWNTRKINKWKVKNDFDFSTNNTDHQDPREALIVALKREVSILQQENNHLRWIFVQWDINRRRSRIQIKMRHDLLGN